MQTNRHPYRQTETYLQPHRQARRHASRQAGRHTGRRQAGIRIVPSILVNDSSARADDSRRNGLQVECQPSQSPRKLVNIIKSSASKLFKYCTIRHIARYLIMTYVHNDIVQKRPSQLTF